MSTDQPLPLRWQYCHGQRAYFPVLTAAQVRYLFDQADKDRTAHFQPLDSNVRFGYLINHIE